jgi:hypothetical protein
MGWSCSQNVGAFNILIGKLKGKRPLGKPGRIWKDNIRIDHKEIGINTRN